MSPSPTQIIQQIPVLKITVFITQPIQIIQWIPIVPKTNVFIHNAMRPYVSIQLLSFCPPLLFPNTKAYCPLSKIYLPHQSLRSKIGHIIMLYTLLNPLFYLNVSHSSLYIDLCNCIYPSLSPCQTFHGNSHHCLASNTFLI